MLRQEPAVVTSGFAECVHDEVKAAMPIATITSCCYPPAVPNLCKLSGQQCPLNHRQQG